MDRPRFLIMALSFLQSPLQALDGVFPGFDLDLPMSDEAQIREGLINSDF
jgi:hypothetical protein